MRNTKFDPMLDLPKLVILSDLSIGEEQAAHILGLSGREYSDLLGRIDLESVRSTMTSEAPSNTSVGLTNAVSQIGWGDLLCELYEDGLVGIDRAFPIAEKYQVNFGDLYYRYEIRKEKQEAVLKLLKREVEEKDISLRRAADLAGMSEEEFSEELSDL